MGNANSSRNSWGFKSRAPLHVTYVERQLTQHTRVVLPRRERMKCSHPKTLLSVGSLVAQDTAEEPAGTVRSSSRLT